MNPGGLHQAANTALADSQAQLLQLGRHARATVAARAQPPLLPAMRKKDHIRALPPAGRARPPGARSPA